MTDSIRDNLAEAAIGLAVVAAAVGFVAFAWARTGAGEGQGGTSLVARFPNIAGVTLGTDVRLAGVKVGRVTAVSLDPGSYQAVLNLSVDPGLKLPVDSSAAITSEGLLGGNYIALTPGAEADMLKDGGEIIETSGAPDLLGLIGSVVNRSGGDAPAAPAAAAETGNAAPR
ncbi:outer membrane lipid asymmetry maintenance protein MlaD [Sandarakinorhabdus rubra]|uniref:outer membrane lipid asymmetry maintenance protein MlaD n=1 Tax=Sandarakinorhabdus rubra TaxID=2672568 RepID=UPI0013DC5B13|nr:outer membrane lipid asymmetry maintenance protein MlaD [Sandarakinorhabdus rubra]